MTLSMYISDDRCLNLNLGFAVKVLMYDWLRFASAPMREQDEEYGDLF
jgi:hypothetical protein